MKTRNPGKLVAALLLGAMLSALLSISACGGPKEANGKNTGEGENGGPEDAENEKSAEAADIAFPHEKRDFGGDTFKVLIDQEDINLLDIEDIDVESLNGEVLNDAYYNRKILVEDTYNIKLEGLHVNNYQITSYVEKSVKSGLDEYDAYAPRLGPAGSFAIKGYGLDLFGTNLSLGAPWWDQNIIADTSINGVAYLIAGDIFIKHYDGISLLMFNKKLLTDLGLENPYQLVFDDKWTMEKFNSMVKGVTLDLDGDGKMDRYDRYGFVTQADYVSSFINASGERIVTKDSGDLPVFVGATEKISNILDRMLDIYIDDTYCLHRDAKAVSLSQFWVFPEGRGLFYWSLPRYINLGLRDMEDDFGILPIPKWDSGQARYYSTLNNWHSYTYMMPVTVADPEKSAYIMDALAYHGRKIVKPAYYDVCLQRKYTRDEESSAMLDIIFGSTCYELGEVYGVGGYIGDIVSDFWQKNSNNMSTIHEKLSGKIEKAISDLIDEFEKNANQ